MGMRDKGIGLHRLIGADMAVVKERQEGRHLVGAARKRPGGIFSTGFSLFRGQHFGK
jgi:hypothetical protein